MKIMDWESVAESAPFEKLPAGGYVCRIVDVEDVPQKEYLNVVYDIAEGPHAGFYSDAFGRENPWAHRFVRSYKATARGMFKSFLCRLEESNPGFTVGAWQRECDERRLKGLLVGLVLQYEDYTNGRGEDKERLEAADVVSVRAVRAGDFTVPPRKDARTAVPGDGGSLPWEAPAPAASAPEWEPTPLSAYDGFGA